LESDDTFTQQHQPAFRTNAIEPCRNRCGIDEIGRLAFEPHHDCLVAAVPTAGKTQRTEQLGLYIPRSLELACLAQAVGENQRGAHRPDGMRAGRPDADLEQVEHTDSHLLTTQRAEKPLPIHRPAADYGIIKPDSPTERLKIRDIQGTFHTSDHDSVMV